jgi:hypothetical protein
MKQYSINVSKEAFLKFLVIENSRPQDMNRAQTFDYILRVFEESPIRIEICKELTKPRTIIPGSASPIIDADNLRIVTPSTMVDKMRKEAQDLALKAARDAPTRNNLYQENKE